MANLITATIATAIVPIFASANYSNPYYPEPENHQPKNIPHDFRKPLTISSNHFHTKQILPHQSPMIPS